VLRPFEVVWSTSLPKRWDDLPAVAMKSWHRLVTMLRSPKAGMTFRELHGYDLRSRTVSHPAAAE